jgi:hypothetical protein
MLAFSASGTPGFNPHPDTFQQLRRAARPAPAKRCGGRPTRRTGSDPRARRRHAGPGNSGGLRPASPARGPNSQATAVRWGSGRRVCPRSAAVAPGCRGRSHRTRRARGQALGIGQDVEFRALLTPVDRMRPVSHLPFCDRAPRMWGVPRTRFSEFFGPAEESSLTCSKRIATAVRSEGFLDATPDCCFDRCHDEAERTHASAPRRSGACLQRCMSSRELCVTCGEG